MNETQTSDIFPLGDVYETYSVALEISNIVGGVPKDPAVVEGWLKAKLGKGYTPELLKQTLKELFPTEWTSLPEESNPSRAKEEADLIERMRSETMVNAFKRDEDGRPCVESRSIKAMLKENANIAFSGVYMAVDGKGKKKTVQNIVAERVFVIGDLIPLEGDYEISLLTRPVHGEVRGMETHSIKTSEVISHCIVRFDMRVDSCVSSTFEKAELWKQVLTRAQENGLGADRSQGFGRFKVIEFGLKAK